MPVKLLFNEDGSVNSEGSQVNMAVQRVIDDMVKVALDQNHSLRDLESLLHQHVGLAIARAILLRRRTVLVPTTPVPAVVEQCYQDPEWSTARCAIHDIAPDWGGEFGGPSWWTCPVGGRFK